MVGCQVKWSPKTIAAIKAGLAETDRRRSGEQTDFAPSDTPDQPADHPIGPETSTQ